jgi:hypothetical protein
MANIQSMYIFQVNFSVSSGATVFKVLSGKYSAGDQKFGAVVSGIRMDPFFPKKFYYAIARGWNAFNNNC